MREFLRSLAMAFLMFSVIPMPRIEWKQENMKYMLACLPLVGAAAGLLQWGWFMLCEALSFGNVLFAAGLTLLPVLITGGIHMDGFCDTVDALASHGPSARKREILKDPHAGAFAVIYAGLWLLSFFALCTELPRSREAVLTLGLHQVFARALGALGSVCLPSASGEGLQHTFRGAASGRAVVFLLGWAAFCTAALCLLSPAGGAACLAVFLFCFLYLRRMAKKQFGGMSGDLAGYIITVSELLMLFAYLITDRMVSLWF